MRRLLTYVIAAHLGPSGVGPVAAQTPEDEMRDFALLVHETESGPLEWRLHTPSDDTPSDLVVMLHGCLQDAADIAAGTRMNEAADAHGFAVLYPQQSPDRNPQKCWNWFAAGAEGPLEAEVAMVTSLVRNVAADLGITPDRTHLVGMSAGGAMASYLAIAHPEMYESVVMHSAIPWGAASTLAEGLAAMQSGGREQVDLADPALDVLLRSDMLRRFLVVQGAEDAVVRPVNGERAAARWVRLMNERARRGADGWAGQALEGPTTETLPAGSDGVEVEVWSDAGSGTVVALAMVPGLGHAWSGGDPEGSYTDPGSLSARDLVVGFLGLDR